MVEILLHQDKTYHRTHCVRGSVVPLFSIWFHVLSWLSVNLSLALLEYNCALCMTVKSAVYKDDNVKCHTSRGDVLRRPPRPFPFHLLWYITLPNHMVVFILFLSFALASFSSVLISFPDMSPLSPCLLQTG